jgi:tRNA U34 5-carboxymethylaminomethyl modifying enzyme MnmG/GidA
MAKRKVVSKRVVLQDGTAITVTALDGILIDDMLISGMKAEGYRVMTGRDAFPDINRKLKDYLIKTGVIQE